MQQGRNNGTEYISLDLATSQRSQNPQNNPENQYESVFYQCFLNKFLAERLLKAGVKKGTCLYVYGDLEIHPFVYSQGQKTGQAGAGAKINVKDWQFCLSNKTENESGANAPGGPAPYNSGAATPGGSGYQNPGAQGGSYQNPAGAAQGGNYQNGNTGGGYSANGNGAGAGSYPNGSAGGNYPVGNNTGGASAQNGSIGNQMYQQAGNTAYGQIHPQGNFAGDGFSNIPEGMASQLPFTA